MFGLKHELVGSPSESRLTEMNGNISQTIIILQNRSAIVERGAAFEHYCKI